MARIAEQLETDQAFQVRYDLLAPLGRAAIRTHTCAPVLQFLDDRAPAVVLRALDVIPAECTDLGDTTKKLIDWADLLGRPDVADQWHVPSRALSALARVNPDEARPRLRLALAHPAWQVRAAAATTARTLGNQNLLASLASSDPHPNVRTAAVEELTRVKSQAVFQPAIAALTGGDYQLLRAAALALKGTPAALQDDASTALLQALDRLTPPEGPTDTSRDPRVAMIDRLGEVLPPERAGELRRFLLDVDPAVRTAAAKAFEARTGAAVSPSEAWRRYPYQPSEGSMTALPKTAEMRMEGGALVTMELFVDQAPVTIARFADLVRAGYYNGLTFHRVVPNFVIQGGSPGANEYVGVARYMRDELGTAPHVRGAVGISTRGRDTGDGQIFIDLVDVPRLDHDYTVFGRVVAGLDVIDKILEGAKITTITVK
jgi:cyclophilin family peptidyl-prolyl cis-trans isomerase/HEAT repeat protein